MITINGVLTADGGDSGKSGFTMYAGGAGGSIKLSSPKIRFIESPEIAQGREFQISAIGGSANDEVSFTNLN